MDNTEKKTIFSFGGGTQSTALAALLLESPEIFGKKGIPLPEYVIFADTGAEFPKVLENVNNVFTRLSAKGFECITVRKENDSILSDRGLTTPPWFVYNPDKQQKGQLRRQCTNDYKIEPIHKKIREINGLKKHQRNIPINIWLGISTDESQRARPDINPWVQRWFPLIDLGLDRLLCFELAKKVFGYAPPKSSCFFCPFIRPTQWHDIRNNSPEIFQKACEIDQKLRGNFKEGKMRTKMAPYVHPYLVPLAEIPEQQNLFTPETCESGYCGV